jgi:uncharacterized protein (DUF362 family)
VDQTVNRYSSYLETLAQQAHADGGWGYAPGQAAHLEPTCLGILALTLEAEKYEPVLDKAKAALERCAMPDGTFRLARGWDEAVWPTALALLVRSVLGYPADKLKPTAARLLALKGRPMDNEEVGEVHDIDVELTGWPWSEGNFSWAEPTAWACLALRRLGLEEQPRVQEGLKLLLDRTADEGGINYGNKRILGRRTEPIPGPTALMLLALQGKEDQPRVVASVQYLMKAVAEADDLEHLCWARLALSLYRSQPGVAEILPRLDERIVHGQQLRAETPWVSAAPLRTALTALALGADDHHPFQLPDQQAPVVRKIEPAGPYVRRASWGERLGAAFKGLAVKAVGQLRQAPPQTAVHIAKASDYNGDLAQVLQEQYQHFRKRVPLASKRVVLKPNLVEYHRDKVINTNPNIVAAVIELCRREGAAEVIVAEGPGHWRNVEYLVSASGLGDVLRHYKVPFVDLNHDEPVKMPNLGRLTGLEHLYLSQTVTRAEVLISLPKLKTHHWAGATLSLKNLFGTLPGICYGWPKNELHWRGIDNSVVDIALTRTPDLAIVDGIIGMEGDGPLNGTAKPMGVLVMGNDLLAVDATCCRLMMLDPEKVGYLALGAMKKLGLLQAAAIAMIGEKIDGLAQPFDTVEHFKGLWVGRSA